MKRIAITGATGFIGFHVARALSRMGHDVTAIGRNIRIGRVLEQGDIYFVRCELSNARRMREAFRGQDVVIHLAGLTRLGATAEEYRVTNVIGTRNVMQAMSGTSVKRWIHVSTAQLYGHGQDQMGTRETEPLGPKNADPFLESKRQNEIDIDNFVVVPSIILRPQIVFGPGDRHFYPFLARFARFKRVPRFDLGESYIDPVYIDNFVDAIAAAVNAPDTCLGKAYNITNGQPVESLAFITTLAETGSRLVTPLKISRVRGLQIAGFLEAIYRLFAPATECPMPAGMVRLLTRSQTLNIDAAGNELGYKPKIAIRAAMNILPAHHRR